MSYRALICTAAGIFSVLFLLAMTPKNTHEPRGIILPSKIVRAPISSDDVKIYEASPVGFSQRLGSVRAELAFDDLNAQTRDLLLDKVKSLAASIGGNGVVVKILVPSDGVRHVLTLVGTVVYIPGKGKLP